MNPMSEARTSSPAAATAVQSAEWVRTLAAPLHRQRWWCFVFAVLLLGFAVLKLWHGSWLDALVALSGALSAWFLYRAASVLSAAHASMLPADAQDGFAALARYFMLSAITSALGLLLLIGAVIDAITQVGHGL
ncbi:MAG: hypothetical protein ACYC97_09835 [Metallibacterium sp.]